MLDTHDNITDGKANLGDVVVWSTLRPVVTIQPGGDMLVTLEIEFQYGVGQCMQQYATYSNCLYLDIVVARICRQFEERSPHSGILLPTMESQ